MLYRGEPRIVRPIRRADGTRRSAQHESNVVMTIAASLANLGGISGKAKVNIATFSTRP